MKPGRHRRRRPVRDFVGGLMLALTLWYYGRWPRDYQRRAPEEFVEFGALMGRLSWADERIPLGVSYEEHMRGVRQIEEYGVSGADAPVS